MPRKMSDKEFLKNRYRWLAQHAKSDSLKLRAADRLAVVSGILKMELYDQNPEEKPKETVTPKVPDLDKGVAEMFKSYGGANAELPKSPESVG